MLTSKTIKPRLFTILLLLTAGSSVAFAAEDEYLKQLEMEADASSGQSKDPKTGEGYLKQLEMEAGDIGNKSGSAKPSVKGTQVLVVDKKELIHDFASFERALKKEYPESYQMYEAFDKEQKKDVYNTFLETKRLYNASVKVTLIYIKSH